MTPFSYDYKNRTLRGVIVKGVPYYDVTSVLECVGYSKPKGRSGWGGKMYYLLDCIPSITAMRIKQRLYCMRGGVFYLFDALLSKKQIHDRDGKKAFFEWFKQLTSTALTAPSNAPNVITMPEQAPADDAAPTVEDLQKMLDERDKKIEELSKQLEETQENNIKLFNDSLRESDELKNKISYLHQKLEKDREYHRRVVMKLLNIEEG